MLAMDVRDFLHQLSEKSRARCRLVGTHQCEMYCHPGLHIVGTIVAVDFK